MDNYEYTCTYPGCDKPCRGKLCGMHYYRKRNGLDMDAPARITNPGEWGIWQISRDGYRIRYKTIAPGKKTYQLEHRFVMEQHIGRELLPNENVHHINGDRADNRLNNLELWVTMQPKGQRPEDLIDYAIEILRTYSPTTLAPPWSAYRTEP